MDGKKCSFTRPSPAKDAGCLLRRPSAVLCNGKGRGGDPWLEKGKQEGEDRKGRKTVGGGRGRRVRGREGEHNTWSVSHPPNLENGRRQGLLGVDGARAKIVVGRHRGKKENN